MGMFPRVAGALARPGEKKKSGEVPAPRGTLPRASLTAGSLRPAVPRDGPKHGTGRVLDSLESCETAIEHSMNRVREGFRDMARALAAIRKNKFYRLAGFHSFDSYSQERWGITRDRARQLIKAEAVIRSLPKAVQGMITNEKQARALADVPIEKRVNVLKQVAASGRITGPAISKAAEPERPASTASMRGIGSVIDVQPEPAKRKVCSHCGGTGYEQ